MPFIYITITYVRDIIVKTVYIEIFTYVKWTVERYFLILPISINKVYILHVFHILACEIGYLGKDCDVKCPFPSYGNECQLRCTCEETDCDFVNGCRRSLNGNFLRKKIINYNLIIFFYLFQSLAVLNFITKYY